MKRSLAVLGCLLVSQSHAAQLPGDFIPQNQFGTDCNPYAIERDFIYTKVQRKRATPRHCATVTASNPVFYWTAPPATDPDPEYAGKTVLRVYSDEQYADHSPVFDRSIPTDTPRMIFPFTLKPGKYTWEVSYVLGGEVVKSEPRRFAVLANYRLPTSADILQKVKAHPRPRALPENHTHAKIAELATGGELAPAFEATKTDAELFRSKTPEKDSPTKRDYTLTLEPRREDHPPMTDQAWKTYLYNAAMKERRAIETLGHMYLFTGESGYLIAFKERLLNLASWKYDAGAPTSEGYQDQANRDIFLALAIGLDLFESAAIGEKLNDEERNLVLGTLKGRIEQARASVRLLGKQPYLPHPLTAVHYLTEALMYAQGLAGFSEADGLLEEAWRDLITSVGAFGGAQDGAYGNGSAYGWYTMNVYARTIAVIRLITGEDLTRFEPFGQIGINQIAQTPPATQAATPKIMGTFGDGVEELQLFWDHGGTDFRLLAHATGKPEYEWYWRTYPDFVTRRHSLTPYHFLLLGRTVPSAPTSAPTLPNSFRFEDAGVVAFHSNTKDPERSSLFFRSSPLGSENHSHADNNSFNFVSRGKEILISSGFYSDYGNKHHQLWTRQTKAKNALTFDGGVGQSGGGSEPGYIRPSVDASGKLVNYTTDGGWRIATGDATDAYRTYDSGIGDWTRLVTAAYRTVAYRPADGVAIVYDYAASDTARNWELNFHTLYEPVLGSGTMTLKGDAGGVVKVCARIQGPAASFAAPVNSFDGTASGQTPFPEWHIRQTTLNKQKEFVAVTILRENCATTVEAPVIDGTSRRVTINGHTITFDKKTVTFD